METLVYEGTMTALTSIAHNGGQSFGIESKLRRERFVQPDGSVEEVPILSGNGLRGMLRDRGMWHMCRALGYGVDEEAGKVCGLIWWSWLDVWSVIIANELPYVEVYDKHDEQGEGLAHARSGTWAGTLGSGMGRVAFLKRFYPELYQRLIDEFPVVSTHA
jgi:3'-phosphoadenosine 5'-phosphosulfate sulfotransferase (PAPS reductase)/FAD synthetase